VEGGDKVAVAQKSVAYPRPAGNVLRLLPFRLRRVHQAVVGSRIRFSAPYGTLLAWLRRTSGLSMNGTDMCCSAYLFHSYSEAKHYPQRVGAILPSSHP
jgi:hypothetical protein